jgi:uncharacterized iron-regulated membrane protein
MKKLLMPSAENPALEWLGFMLFLLLMCIAMGGLILWVQKRKGHKFKRKHHHRHRRRHSDRSPMQNSALPPKRDSNPPPAS